MGCPSCNHDNRSDRRFCTECGARLPVGCPSCGASTETGEKFCGGCGAALTTGGRAPTTPSPAGLGPRLFADKIRRSKAAVEGERKQVAALFADVTGSLELPSSSIPKPGRRSCSAHDVKVSRAAREDRSAVPAPILGGSP